MADPELIEQDTEELAALVEQARSAELPPLHGVKQYQMVRAALRQSREPARLMPRIARCALGLAAALLMGLLGARAFEYGAARLATSHVEVAPGGRPARLRLRTGDALVLARGSAIDVLSETTTRRELRLTRGAVLCDVKRLGPGQVFELRTPHAHARVRGTVFSVQVDDRHTTLQVHEGTVEVAERVLHAGERWSSLSTAPRVDHALFAAEVRAALAARGAAPVPSEPPALVEPRAVATMLPGEPVAPATPEPHAQRDDANPAPAAPRHRAAGPEPLPPRVEATEPPSAEAADQMLRQGQADALLDALSSHRHEPAYARVYADALRASGDFERASRAYEALSEQSQGSLHSQAGYAAAQLALGPLRDPLRALNLIEHFELTAPSSPLSERASVLRIDALLALGRRAEARAAALVYLAHEPDTETSARLRRLADGPQP